MKEQIFTYPDISGWWSDKKSLSWCQKKTKSVNWLAQDSNELKCELIQKTTLRQLET